MKTGRYVIFFSAVIVGLTASCSNQPASIKPEKTAAWQRWRIPLYDAPLSDIKTTLNRNAARPSIRLGDDRMGYIYDGKTITFYYRKAIGVKKVYIAGMFNKWLPNDNRWKMKPGKASDRFFTLSVPISRFGEKAMLFKFVANGESWQMYSPSAGPGQWD